MLRAGRRGQIVSYDLLVAVVVFLLIFTFSIVLWVDNLNKVVSEQALGEMQFAATELTDALISSQGNPSNWHILPSYDKIGLVEEKRVISIDRLNAFRSENYLTLKEKMNIEDYNFYITIDTDTNTVFEYPEGAIISGMHSLTVRRGIEYSGEIAVFSLTLFKEE